MSQWLRRVVEKAHAAASKEEVFGVAREAARELNFEFCAYLLSGLFPCAQPKTISISNFPNAWRQRYELTGAQRTDPTITHCRHSNQPLIWSEAVFAQNPSMWTDAVECGVPIAWSIGLAAPSTLGARGMITFARSSPAWANEELSRHEQLMTLIAKVTHEAMLRVSRPTVNDQLTSALTDRESEVLRWTGDGKTAAEIARILSVSENTIKFHVKNAMVKLRVNNKTAAVLKAAILGLLH